jgi:hypothetical protein
MSGPDICEHNVPVDQSCGHCGQIGNGLNEEEQEIFAALLFKRYEEAMRKLHVVRKARYEAEVEMINLKEEIELLTWQIKMQEAHEVRIGAREVVAAK